MLQDVADGPLGDPEKRGLNFEGETLVGAREPGGDFDAPGLKGILGLAVDGGGHPQLVEQGRPQFLHQYYNLVARIDRL